MSNALQIVGGGYTALIRQDHDGNCIALRHASGTDILRTPLTEEAFQKYPNVYGMPLFRPTVFETAVRLPVTDIRFPINEPARNHHILGLLSVMPFQTAEIRKERVAFALYTAWVLKLPI